MKSFPPEELYYITHIDNLQSILEKGIPSHEKIQQQKIEQLSSRFRPILDNRVVTRRKAKSTPAGRSLLDYASLYFQPRNPMMYSIVGVRKIEKLVVISISKEVLHEDGVFITDGNSAIDLSKYYSLSEGLRILERQWKTVQNEWWNEDDGSKRKIMAECLVPDNVKPEFISSIFVAEDEAKDKAENCVMQTVGDCQISVISEPRIFFQPESQIPFREDISLIIDGDMFYSTMQTLTITVNLQGIMGKGLALRAKQQFPDVYVKYQDACRNKKIRAGRPYLYKRETSFNQELADPSITPSTSNAMKWFLLFATKRKWQEDSQLEDIERGLDWLKKNCEKEDIKSLALPALGCGLGNLSWTEQVEPLMRKYLGEMKIPIEIYLPRELKIDRQSLDESYLLWAQTKGADSSQGLLPFSENPFTSE